MVEICHLWGITVIFGKKNAFFQRFVMTEYISDTQEGFDNIV